MSALRDCEAWRDAGLILSTTSNEACKLFDAALNQYVTWTNDQSLGGLEGTLSKLHVADPNFVMGSVMANGLVLVGTGTSVRLDKKLDDAIKNTVSLSHSQPLTEREKRHVSALELFARGTPKEDDELRLAPSLGLPLLQAFVEFDEGHYDRVVELLYPVRYQLVKIGGSEAQRDIFAQFLIHAALKSESKANQRLARCLLIERDELRPNSPLTERLMRKAVALHAVG